MLKQILDIITVLIEASTKVKATQQNTLDRKDKIELLKSYFLFQGVLDDGEKLLASAEPNPTELIKTLERNALDLRLDLWDSILRRQGVRLYKLNAFISSRSDLTVLNLRAQRNLKVIIGSKLDSVNNLFELGAGLFFRTKLYLGETTETLAELTTKSLLLDTSKPFHPDSLRTELHALSEAIEEYRLYVVSCMSNDDIRKFSNQARQAAEEDS